MGKRSQGRHGGRPNHCLLQVDSVVDKSDVGRGVLGEGALVSQEVHDLGLDVRMLTVFNMLSQYHQGLFSLGRADFHDAVDDRLTEQDVRVILEAVGQESEENSGLTRDTVV